MKLHYRSFPQARPPVALNNGISVPRIRIGLLGPRSSIIIAQVGGTCQAVGGAQILQKEGAG